MKLVAMLCKHADNRSDHSFKYPSFNRLALQLNIQVYPQSIKRNAIFKICLIDIDLKFLKFKFKCIFFNFFIKSTLWSLQRPPVSPV